MKRCLKCSGETAVKDVLPEPEGVYRKRVCKSCEASFFTIERPCDPPATVVRRHRPEYHEETRRAAALAGIPISHFWVARQHSRWHAEQKGLPHIEQYRKDNLLTIRERIKLGMPT
jgi:hypothetical protein